MSRTLTLGSGNATDSVAGRGTINIQSWPSANPPEQLSLPSQGSQVEFVISLPPFEAPGYFNIGVSTFEYNPRSGANARVYVGGEQPAGTTHVTTPLVLPAPTAYPIGLGRPDYETDFLGDIWADGWRRSRRRAGAR